MPFLLEKLDLELAWRRVKNDLAHRSFVRPSWEVELAEADLPQWLDAVRSKTAAGYAPHAPIITDVPKGNGGVRPAALLTLEDRLVYTAAVGALLPSVNDHLAWSQGKIDFSYRLSESPRRVDWFTNAFNGWSAFRKKSLEKIAGVSSVVTTDITGFYENIDLMILASDLRGFGCDAQILHLLQTCLNRWCVVPGRGVPQGLSPSDVLAKVYLNSIDQALNDFRFDHIRYVDDIRLFCADHRVSKIALMTLSQLLRRRGLNLQSSKTDILSAEKARSKIEGIAPVIAAVQQKYRKFIEAFSEMNPSVTISELEANIDPNDPPVEVVREAFKDNFIKRARSFNRTLFHFLLNRLGAQKDRTAVDYCLPCLVTHPEETEPILKYIAMLDDPQNTFPAVENFLKSQDCIYDFQVYQIFSWLNALKLAPTIGLISVARKITFDNSRASYVRAETRIVLQNFGTFADLERLEASYGTVHEELEKAQVLVSMRRMEEGRRNSFYGRATQDGLLCSRAISLIKAGRL